MISVYRAVFGFHCVTVISRCLIHVSSNHEMSNCQSDFILTDSVVDNETLIDLNLEKKREMQGDVNNTVLTTHVYKRRWIIILLYCLFAMSTAYQWIHLVIISNIIIKYYSESLPDDKFQRETTLDSLTMIYMVVYILLVFPATFLLKKKGIRICLLTSTFLNALGAWLKVYSVAPDRFAALMFSQTACAIAQVFMLGLPAKIAAVWFGAHEVSTATSLGTFGIQIGLAVGFFVPPNIVRNSDSTMDIGKDLSLMFYGGAGYMTFILILIVIFFKERPPTPPSQAQALAVQDFQKENYGNTLQNIFKNFSFNILLFTFGVNIGCNSALSTLLNPIISEYFPQHETTAGRIGLTMILSGVPGSIMAGIWLDKTKTYKGTALGINFFCLTGILIFNFALHHKLLWVVYLCAGIYGFFIAGYFPVCFEFATEISYPVSGGISSCLLFASSQLFGIVFIIGCRAMMNKVGTLGFNLLIPCALLVTSIFTGFIPANYRRQNAEKMILEQSDNVFEIETVDPASEESRISKINN